MYHRNYSQQPTFILKNDHRDMDIAILAVAQMAREVADEVTVLGGMMHTPGLTEVRDAKATLVEILRGKQYALTAAQSEIISILDARGESVFLDD